MDAHIGAEIRTIREKVGMTQDELAKRLGITASGISQIEGGARNPKLSTICRIAVALEVPVSALLKPILSEETNMKFYFTYGIEGQPFVGGWTEVEAQNGHAACAAFRAYHPDKTDGLLNCSSVYSEEEFKRSVMYEKGNFNARCHEVITLRRDAAAN